MLYDKYIDINADVGEGINNEALLMPYLSSCNIACGGHAGNFETMSRVVKLAKTYRVKVGAHPSFPDTINFGRKIMEMPQEDLFNSLRNQIQNLMEVVSLHKMKLFHIKPHGALYNLAIKDQKTADVIVQTIISFDTPLKLYAPYKSVISKRAKLRSVEVVYEGFADRNYHTDLSLVSRHKNEALITEKESVFAHVFNMVSNNKINTIDGVEVSITADTICVHGDTKNAVEILKYLHKNLLASGIKIV